MDKNVEMGQAAVVQAEDADYLISTGIGSCVVITLYDAKKKIGALAHPMHSSYTRKAGDPGDETFIDVAVEKMLIHLFFLGVNRENLEAKIIGGANMFEAFTPHIARNNVACAKEKLRHEHITLAGECVGGSIGRSVEFDLKTGIVTVKIKF